MRAKLVKNRVKAFFVLSAFVVVIFFKILQVVSVDILMDDIHKLEQERRNLYSETERMQSRLDKLSNIDKINQNAAKKLGLINNEDKIYYLRIAEYRELQNMKENFARRNGKNVQELNLAGVH